MFSPRRGESGASKEAAMRRRVLLAALLVLPLTAALALETGEVRGIVHDPQHRPIAGATITLRDPASTWSATVQSGPEGEFHFSGVPVGKYIRQRHGLGVQCAGTVHLGGRRQVTRPAFSPGDCLFPAGGEGHRPRKQAQNPILHGADDWSQPRKSPARRALTRPTAWP